MEPPGNPGRFNGRGFKPGVYLVRLTQGAASRTRRVVVLGD
jgi:hypothetical protein